MTSWSLGLLVGLCLWETCAGAPQVTAPWGRVAGLDWDTASGWRYYAYLAIPYAQPPVGELRFQQPRPHPGISNTHNVTQRGPACLQPNSGEPTSEDCLTLDVFVPGPQGQRSTSGYDVIVWIHGGGYRIGSARRYDPYRLVMNNVLVVVVQYRLGPLGFLSTGDAFLPGNYGLWDQRLALKWVQDNIRAFGGNPGSVTIMGESAGGSSVTQHLLSPHSTGLFQRALAQSGSATALFANYLTPRPAALALAVSLGCLAAPQDYSSQRDAMLACLRAKDAKAVSDGLPTLELDNWIPVVDGDFVVQDPRLALQDPAFLSSLGFFDHDLMMGVNNNEGVATVALYTPAELKNASAYRRTSSLYLGQIFGENYNPDMLDVLEYQYTYPRDPASPGLVSTQGFFDTLADLAFTGPTVEMMKAHARAGQGTGSSYLYLFDYSPASSPYGGMAHGQDEIFLFPYTAHTDNSTIPFAVFVGTTVELDAADEQVAQYFANFLVQFANTGNPNAALAGNLAGTWPQFNNTHESYLSFGSLSTVQQQLYPRRVGLYLDIFPRMQRRWQDFLSSSASTTTSEPCDTTVAPARLERFNLSIAEADNLIIGLIAAVGVLFLLLCTATYCLCSQKSGKAKYQM